MVLLFVPSLGQVQGLVTEWVDAQAVLVRISARLLKKTLLRTDERAKLEGELLDGVDVVKCMTWEVSLLNHMLQHETFLPVSSHQSMFSCSSLALHECMCWHVALSLQQESALSETSGPSEVSTMLLVGWEQTSDP